MAADLLVADDIDELILGYDWLLLQEVDWNFRQFQLVLYGVTIPLTSRPAQFSLRHVYIRELASASPTTNDPKAAEALDTAVGNGMTPPSEQDTTARPGCEHVQSVIDTLAIELSLGEKAEASELLHTYQDVFTKSEYDLGRTSMTEHNNDTGNTRPIKQGLRKQPQTSLPIIENFTKNMERQHIIEKSASPWACNVVVVNKHDGTPRITLDYRALNNVTYKDCYPLPNISDCLDAFKGSSWFAILDLRSSYYQVPFADVDRGKTAFITRQGQWRFCALPMGLSNSPATFQRRIDLVPRGLMWESVLVYIDDIVVYTHTIADLKMRLEEVFIRLRGVNLKLKPTKVKLLTTQKLLRPYMN